jgi:nicotinic acid mononucleotide adenylyltransferase
MAKKAVITWGRMNPPTKGHQKLVDTVILTAKAEGADPMVFLSHTQDENKNPLDYNTKNEMAIKAFGAIVKRTRGLTTIDAVFKSLGKQGYDEVTLLVGSDRVKSMKSLERYAAKFKLKTVNVISKGLERNPDADDATGISASKARALAFDGDFGGFSDTMPIGLDERQIKKIYLAIRRVIGKRRARRDPKTKTAKPTPSAAMPSNLKPKAMGDKERKDFLSKGLFDHVEHDNIQERVVTFQQRRAKSRLMKRLAPRMKRKREIAAKKMAKPERLQMRTKKQAKQMLRDRFAGERGKNYTNLTPQAKIAVDKQIEKKGSMINRFAKRLLPKVRKAEMQRLKDYRTSLKTQKEEMLHEDFTPGIAPTIFAKDLSKLAPESVFRMHPSVEVEEEILEVGTDKLRNHYEEGTPDQKLSIIQKILDL